MGMRERRRPIRLLASVLLGASALSCGPEPTSVSEPRHRNLTERLDTRDITFFMTPGDSVNVAYQQAFHEWAIPYLGIAMPRRLRYLKYLDNGHMRELTGQPYGSWADVENYTIHSVETRQGHEAVHVYSYVIGWPSDFFTEGIAVALDVNPFTGQEVPFFGAPVHALCRTWLAEGTLYPLRDLVANDGFWTGRWTQTYPQSGSFTQFLVAEFGLKTLKEIFRTVDDFDSTETILAAFKSAYGITLDEAESRWHSFLRGS